MTIDERVKRLLEEALIPGWVVIFDPDEAERVGAFESDAVTIEDALACGADLLEEQDR